MDRRDALSRGMIALTGSKSLPLIWTTPTLVFMSLPAHAQTSIAVADATASIETTTVEPNQVVEAIGVGGQLIEGEKVEFDEMSLGSDLSASLSIPKFENTDNKNLSAVRIELEAAFERKMNISNPRQEQVVVKVSTTSTSQFDLLGGKQSVDREEESRAFHICGGRQAMISIGTRSIVDFEFETDLDFFVGTDDITVEFIGEVDYSVVGFNDNSQEPDVSTEFIEDNNRVCVIARYIYTMIQPEVENSGDGNVGGVGNVAIGGPLVCVTTN